MLMGTGLMDGWIMSDGQEHVRWKMEGHGWEINGVLEFSRGAGQENEHISKGDLSN